MEPVILRTDSAHYGHATVTVAQRAGADVWITARDGESGVVPTGEIRELPIQAIYRAIGTTGDNARTKTQYTNAIYDHDRDTSMSDAC